MRLIDSLTEMLMLLIIILFKSVFHTSLSGPYTIRSFMDQVHLPYMYFKKSERDGILSIIGIIQMGTIYYHHANTKVVGRSKV